MVDFELDCDFVLVEKIFLSGILSNKENLKNKLKIKIKSEEEKKSTYGRIVL